MPRASGPFWLQRPSRFAGLSRTHARWACALLAVLVLASWLALAVPAAPSASGGGAQAQGDLALYEGVVAAVRHGENYYVAASDALRAGGYPLRPFVTVRLPGLAMLEAWVPDIAALALLYLLAFAVMAAWALRIAPALPRRLPRIALLLLLAGGLAAFVQAELIAFHEIWAGLLVALSLAVRRPGRWVEAAALGLIAVLIRETAALYLLVMALFAWWEGARREALGWGAALLVFALVLAVHAHAVAGVTGPLDARSPGWAGLHGFGLFVKAVALSTALTLLPLALAAPLVALALFGWASWNDPLGLRAVTVFALYAAAIGVFARLDTFYWGLMVAPVLLAGLVFVPDGLRDLAAAALDRRRVRVQIVGR